MEHFFINKFGQFVNHFYLNAKNNHNIKHYGN